MTQRCDVTAALDGYTEKIICERSRRRLVEYDSSLVKLEKSNYVHKQTQK